MICPKCGEEYEDDMQCCLWCDAPNPNYGRVEKAECKVGSVQKRNQGEINGFDYLEHSDEVDFAQRTSGYVVFKIAKFEFVKTIVGMLFCLGPFLFSVAAMFFVEELKSLWPLWLLVSVCFAICIFVLSRTVLAVKWYKDKFVLKTLYGETELSFDKSVFAEFGYEDDKGFSVCLKKEKWSFVLREKAFPEVTKMLCRIYDELNPKDIVQGGNGSVYAVFKPLKRPVGMVWYVVAFLFNVLIAIGNVLVSDTGKAAFAGVFAAVIVGYAFYHLRDVFEIRWYKDRFVLFTRFGEKSFSFDRSELHKTKRDERDALMFFFKKGRWSFVVDERVFPEVAEMMKTHYGVG
ncbi:hypothetical protein [Fibrobacter succinogenes]|uniref:hypothetical protein n=1 Tax=Fibrobacter succinogenes TaxID=833 RepID=UPI00156772FC|nr:hypothetical protein [Fibrobacter succinogenes]